MTIVFSCPKCNFVMKVPYENGGARTKCLQCGLTQVVPLPTGKLIEVRRSEAASAPVKPVSKSTPPSPKPEDYRPPPPNPAEELLKQAAAKKDAGDWNGGLALLLQAFREIYRSNRAYPVDTYLLLPQYLEHTGKSREAWQEFNQLLFRGYSNQSKDPALLAMDRSKILDRMRLFLEHDEQMEIAAVYEAFSMVFKGISLYRDNRKRELKTWFSRENCTEFLHGLKSYKGNLGRVHELHAILLEEIGQYPELDFDQMGERVEAALSKG